MIRFLTALCLGVFLSVSGPMGGPAAFAQTTLQSTPDYAAWERVATRAEAALESGKASDAAFGVLRQDIVNWRTQFQAQLSANDSRIKTLNEQIAALGPAPEEGSSEAAEIGARRSELQRQLEVLTTPRRTAEEAFSRANGLVSEIDKIIRARQSDELLRKGPVPLDPSLWNNALRDLRVSLTGLWDGVTSAFSNPTARANAQNNLPLIMILFVAATVLLLRSRTWSEQFAVRIQARETQASAGFTGFVVSLGQILFPILGIFALMQALDATGFYGPRGDMLISSLPIVGVIIFSSRWLGSRIFPKAQEVETPMGLGPKRRWEGRVYAMLLGIILALRFLLERLSDFDRHSLETTAVLDFPLIALAGIILFRIGQLLHKSDPSKSTLSAEGSYRSQVVPLLSKASMIIGLGAPVLAIIGYSGAALALIYPAILSLALCGAITQINEAVRDLFAFFSPSVNPSEALLPTLINFFLLVLTLPVFALIWGARLTDLTELWSRFRNGVSIGDTTISPGSFITLIVVFMIGYFLTRAVQGTMKNNLLPKTKLDPGAQVAMVSGLGYVGIFLAALIAITSAGIDLSSLAIVAGALSVGIGFGLQNIVSNFVSGIILLIERPISEGDWIEVGGQMGYVRDISVRSTRIETFDRTDVIVPNADLVSGTVTNYTRGNTIGRLIVPVGVAYGNDTRRIEEILREIASAHPMVLANPAPAVVFSGFGADSLDFEIRVILRDVNWMLSVKSEMNHQIAERFATEGIEIPFAQRDIWLRNPEALKDDGA
ncbi:putative MscS family protein.1 [Ascidiaceihabitans donghaensis]|uniref:Putative MscS family protein.1 n=1 Tax=Ascidiaceihabitans donghaensis TaxID=1510460 RepID=A0A2R8BDX5_9RHOB|nr:DUF3772 domain-containing protein [Ascidiaceihabitans donghaensis]SPH21149.1 putative MscS family protein.1 [Ascidiaceihabitans donghaensis]